MSDKQQEILDELAIDSDLSEEFSRQASYFASWGFEHAVAEAEARRTEEAKDVTGARLGRKYRGEHKAPKEAEIKEYVTRHPAYRKAVKLWHDAKFNRDILRIAVESFKQRKDMLVQLGADKRAELDQTDLSLRKKTKRANKILREVMQDKTTKAKRKRSRTNG